MDHEHKWKAADVGMYQSVRCSECGQVGDSFSPIIDLIRTREQRDEYKRQRDDLLAALEPLIAEIEDPTADLSLTFVDLVIKTKAAIASVKGQANE